MWRQLHTFWNICICSPCLLSVKMQTFEDRKKSLEKWIIHWRTTEHCQIYHPSYSSPSPWYFSNGWGVGRDTGLQEPAVLQWKPQPLNPLLRPVTAANLLDHWQWSLLQLLQNQWPLNGLDSVWGSNYDFFPFLVEPNFNLVFLKSTDETCRKVLLTFFAPLNAITQSKRLVCWLGAHITVSESERLRDVNTWQ